MSLSVSKLSAGGSEGARGGYSTSLSCRAREGKEKEEGVEKGGGGGTLS